jgi:hypothetical protein
MAGDQNWYSKVLGLHCDGTNGSTTFTDVKSKTVSVFGNAQISTAQYPSLTGKTSAAYFDGSGDYLTLANSSDFDFGSGDFTVSLFARLSSMSGAQYIIHRGTATGYTAWSISAGGGQFSTNGSVTGSSYAWTFSSTNTFSNNTWYHVMLVRSGTNIYLFVNGALEGSATSVSGSLMTNATTVKIGRDDANVYQVAGYLSEIEIYKGVAIKTSAFSPPSIPFYDEYVSVSGTTKDSSGAFASRLVRVYRQDTGAFAGEQLSNATTGAWKITAANTGSTVTKHFAVMHDDDANPPTTTENALIYDDITPV